MNIAKTIIILVGVAVLGYLGYYFYSTQPEEGELSYQNNSEDFSVGDESVLESDLNYLEGIEFENNEESTLESEQAFESQISDDEQQEASFDAELDELEALEF